MQWSQPMPYSSLLCADVGNCLAKPGVRGVACRHTSQLGSGVLIDHATGVVIGETAVVGNNVSMLHHVTLGGSGTGKGIRHPTIGTVFHFCKLHACLRCVLAC